MSRTGYDWYEPFPNAYAFWQHNLQRMLRGKRGRKALEEVREALLMLPEKRLVAGALSTAALQRELIDDGDDLGHYFVEDARAKCAAEGIGVCAVGAYLMRKRVLELGETPTEAMINLPSLSDDEGHYVDETAAEGEKGGLPYLLGAALANLNDEDFGSETPEQRYQSVLNWVEYQLAKSRITEPNKTGDTP